MRQRIRVTVPAEEGEAFRRRAAAEGVSLSAWLGEAGRRRLAEAGPRSLADPGALRKFFASLPDAGTGSEPEWDEHLAVIEASRREGTAPS
jgi:hypothetical protein